MTKHNTEEDYCPQETRIKVLETQYCNLNNRDEEFNQNIKELGIAVAKLCKSNAETLAVFNLIKWLMGILITCYAGLIITILLDVI